MSTTSNPYRGFRYPAEIINQAVWLYHCFSLSLREVELILAARGIVVSYETIREWSLRFGRTYAKSLKRHRPRPGEQVVPGRGVRPDPRQAALSLASG
jgi:putative transposase